MTWSHDDLLDTIRRLIALGASPNEHEAKLATAKAARLMAEHNIALLDVEQAAMREWCEEEIFRSSRTPQEVAVLASILTEFFFVKALEHSGAPATLTLFGDRSNIEVAKYVFTYLLRTFRGLAKDRGVPRADRNTYFRGLALGFSETMRDQRRRAFGDRTMMALVRVDAELVDAIKAAYPKLGRYALAPARGSRKWMENGIEDGRTISLRPGLRTGVGTQLLPGGQR